MKREVYIEIKHKTSGSHRCNSNRTFAGWRNNCVFFISPLHSIKSTNQNNDKH